MPGNWNPNHPGVIGLEWLVDADWVASVSPGAGPTAQQLRSTQAEAVTGLALAASGNPNVTSPLFTIIDIYPAASAYPGAAARQAVWLPPNADLNRGTWVRSDGGTVNLWSFIDDPVVLTPTAYIRQSTSGTSAYKCYIDDSALPPNARVCQVQARAVIGAHPNPTITTRAFAFRLEWVPTGTLYTPPNSSFNANIYGQVAAVTFGEVNPRTNLPWTRADLAQFNGGNWALRVEAVGDPNTWARIDAMALLVDYVTTENRVAAATWARPSGPLPPWVNTAGIVTLPSGASGWSKPASGDFVFVWRAANHPFHTGGQPRATDVRWVGALSDLRHSDGSAGGGLAGSPVPGQLSGGAPVDVYGLVTAPFTAAEAPAMGIVLVKSGPAYSDDSQPYLRPSSTGLAATAASPAAQRARQVTGSPQSYLGLRFLAAPPASGASTLTVSVHLVSSGAQVGGAFTVTNTEALAFPQVGPASGGWRLIEGFLSSGAMLANNTQYEVRFTPSAGTWRVTNPDAGTYAAAGYRGTTDTARSGGTALSTVDLGVSLLVQPAAPGDVAAATVEWEVATATGCRPGAMDQVVVSWVPTVLGAGFARYEIERRRQDGDWVRVADLDTETDTSWVDLEPARNRPFQYRARTIATTGAFSAWVETGPVTPVQDHSAVIFTSNAAPELTVMFDHDPSVSFDFPDHDTDEVIRPYGADGVIVFFEPEDRGVTKQYRLTVNFADVPRDGAGRLIGDDALWEPLRRLTRSTAVPYVAVLDSYGNVSYAHVTLSGGEREQPGDRYYVDATVVPVQFLPTAVT